MWVTYIAPHQDPKKMVKRKEKFLPLESDKKNLGGVSQEQRERFMKEFVKYQEKIKAN